MILNSSYIAAEAAGRDYVEAKRNPGLVEARSLREGNAVSDLMWMPPDS